MFKATIIIILGIVLAVGSVIFVIKNFLVDYKGSDNGFKNVSNIFLIVASLICSLISVWEGLSIVQSLDLLKNPVGMKEEMIQLLEASVVQYSKDVNIAIVVGYVCFGLACLVFLSIKKEIQRETDKPMRKWDWTKIDKN